MNCTDPPALEDTALLRYLDGEAESEAVQHLEQCPSCRRRAESIAQLQQRLGARLYRMDCPSTLEVGEHAMGLLTGPRQSAVTQHVAHCPLCSAEQAQLREFLAQPDPVLHTSRLQDAARQLRLTIAQLLSGPALAPALGGLRGSEEQPFIFAAGPLQVLVEVEDTSLEFGKRRMLGLVTGAEDPGEMQAHLWLGAQEVASKPLDPLGNFVFEGLELGRYDLILGGLEAEVFLPDIAVT